MATKNPNNGEIPLSPEAQALIYGSTPVAPSSVTPAGGGNKVSAVLSLVGIGCAVSFSSLAVYVGAFYSTPNPEESLKRGIMAGVATQLLLTFGTLGVLRRPISRAMATLMPPTP